MPNYGDTIRWRPDQYPQAQYEEFPSGQGGPHAMGGSDHTADTIQNIRTKCSDATIETTAGSAAAAAAAVAAHKDLATGVHGAGASTLATTANIATHAGLTASVHGFDVSGNAPAQTHDNTRHTDAYAKDSDLSTHTGLTTTAHGGLIASAEKAAASGVASLNSSSKVVQDCANAQTPAAHDQAATTITTGTLDGDRLPAMSTTKLGGVPATGTPASKFLRDDGTWQVPTAAPSPDGFAFAWFG